MASIQKRGRKWIVRWRDPDGGDRSRSCGSRESADHVRREVEAANDRGIRWEPHHARPVPRLREVAAAWITARSIRLAPKTLLRYAHNSERFVAWMERKHGKAVGLDRLSRAVLEAYWRDVTGMPELGKQERSLATARKHIEAVELMWLWAYDREEYEGSCPRPRRLELPPKPSPAPAMAPTWAQMDAAVRAARGWLACLLVVMRCTGLRVTQAMTLRWDDVDEAEGLIRVRGEVGKSAQEKRGRLMPAAPAFLAALKDSSLAWDRACGYVVPDRPIGGGKWQRAPDAPAPREKRREAIRAWRRSGVPSVIWQRRPNHAFRKGFISGLRAAGADPTAVEWLVGHRLPGEQEPYVDPWRALPLRDAVALVPPVDLVGGGA